MEFATPYQVMLNVAVLSFYTKTYDTTDNEQVGQICVGQAELNVLRTGHDAIMEKDAIHIEN